jgi:hypothetical protein
VTGVLTVLGRGKGRYEWDTDKPVSVEDAKRAFKSAVRAGSLPFDTQAQKPVSKLDFEPGKVETPQDVTMVPRFAGGM